jgi:hypothetical protein
MNPLETYLRNQTEFPQDVGRAIPDNVDWSKTYQEKQLQHSTDTTIEILNRLNLKFEFKHKDYRSYIITVLGRK